MPATPAAVARRWSFTNFKFDTIELETFCELGLENETALRYICFGLETCPDTGKPHMQGYCELHRPMRRASVQKILGRLGCDPKCHVEAAREVRACNQNYCRKDGDFFEAGSWESGGQGARTDLHPAIDLAKTAPTAWSIIEQYPAEYCKYSRGLDRIRVLAAKRAAREYRPIEVHVLWGDPGTRKTDMTGLNTDHDVFPVACGDTFPFDNYDGEGTIVFDDFYGQLRCADMLSWCNGQYGSVNIKGGSAYRAWKKVYITSNTAPDTWYPNVPQKVRAAFLSRLTTVTHVVGANQRPTTKHFVLNTLSGERNEVDCNTMATLSPVPASTSPPCPLPPPAIDDPLVLAAIAELFDSVEPAATPVPDAPPSLAVSTPPRTQNKRRRQRRAISGPLPTGPALTSATRADPPTTVLQTSNGGTTLGGPP